MKEYSDSVKGINLYDDNSLDRMFWASDLETIEGVHTHTHTHTHTHNFTK